jgi:hypothetical protein
MLFAVKYVAGRFAGTRMVNAETPERAIERVRSRLREELPVETKQVESYEVALPGEPLDP